MATMAPPINSSTKDPNEHSVDVSDPKWRSGDEKRQCPHTEKNDGALPAPVTAVDTLSRWNSPRIHVWRYFITLLGFCVMGLNDGALGPLLPYIEAHYGVSYTVVSLMFLAPCIGYSAAATINNRIHMRFGQLGVAVLAPCSRLVAYVVICNHPPYPVLPIFNAFAGFGNGLEDAAWNAWVGGMANANELLGILHGFYGLGATLSPLIATPMVTTARLPWYTFYYIMIGISVIELICGFLAFRTATASKHQAANASTSDPGKSNTREALRNRVSWICAVFLLGYVGVEVSLGGWLVTFMLRVREGGAFASGMTATGFWLGITSGRVVLGFVTPRLGEKLAIAIYLLLCIALELMFWLIPSFVASAVFAGFLGFFMGPLFPAAVVAATKLLPRHLHVSSIGFAAAFGGGGAALFPFVVGAIASARGVQVLQPIVLALLAAILLLWCALPGGFKKNGLETARAERSQRINRQDADGTEMQWFDVIIARLRNLVSKD